MKDITINIGAIGYELGEHPVALEDNVRLTNERKSQLFLRTMGFAEYQRTDRTLGELSECAIKKTLSKANIPAEKVDIVVYASSTFGDRHGDVIDKDVAQCLINCGLQDVYPIGVYLSQCNNFFAALDIAVQYLKNEVGKTALLVFADRVLDEATRFKNLAINSDAAVACIVSSDTEIELEFEVSGISKKTKLTTDDLIDPHSNSMNLEVHENYLAGIRHVFDTALSQSRLYAQNLKQIICHNFSYSALRQIANAISVNENIFYKNNIPKFGHAYTCDSLINLDSYHQERTDPIASPEHIAVIGTGLYFWGMVVLTVRQKEAP
ncbi:hypothetical protein ACWA06_04755 [Serratia rhizosphaerae]|uniref:hypothetical protein n=1 Tax=Serratia sp. Tan611 TaxID=2773264 RepID=UPI00193317E0|nr:hypothetical protein [Serratia sp. Tan611]CAE1147818.1 3-oxoacyl-ACP synthase [Serratia sp. Tan611]